MDVRTLWYLAVGCRGIEYIGGVRDTDDAFKAQCAKSNVEWLVPSALPQEPQLPKDTQIPPPGTYIRGSGTYIEPGLFRVSRLYLFKEYTARIVMRFNGREMKSFERATRWDHYGLQHSVLAQIQEARKIMGNEGLDPTSPMVIEVIRITSYAWKVPQQDRYYTDCDQVPFPDFKPAEGLSHLPPRPPDLQELVWTSREPDQMPADLPVS